MCHRNSKLLLNLSVSAVLVVAPLASTGSSQNPTRPPQTDRDAINQQIQSTLEKLRNRKRPEIPKLKGLNLLLEGIRSAQQAQSQTATSGNTPAQNSLPRIFVVTSTADNGPGSLRRALADASNRDTIKITATGAITLTAGELLVDKSLIIHGPGANKLSVSGGGASRVFHTIPNTIVTISGLAIINGNAPDIVGIFPDNAGGGIYNDHAMLNLSGCLLSNNSARFGGGVFSNSKDGGNASLTVFNSTISNNSAPYGGGILSGGGFIGVGNPSGSAALMINNSTISGNSADIGAGILNDGALGSAMLTVNGSEITGNSLTHSTTSFAGGAGIYNNGDSGVASLEINDSSVNGNGGNADIGLEGTGIVNDGSASFSEGKATASLHNSAVDNNLAGGGIFSFGSAVLVLTDTSVNGNNAGGILSSGRLLTTNCRVNNNVGIGINAQGLSAVLTTTTISNNNAGGILNGHSDLTLIRSSVTGNSADLGGGIANFSANLSLIDSTVAANSAQDAGGGISNEGGDAVITIRNSTVSNNSAAFAPGIYSEVFDSSATVTLTVTNSTFSGNVSPCLCPPGGFNGDPGGIFNSADGGNSTLTVNNSTFSDNAGWGILNYNFDPLASVATVDIANTILAAGPASGGIANVDGTITSHGYNLCSDAAGGDGSTGPGGLLNGPGDIRNTNPQLGPLQDNGGPTLTQSLLPNSPAIDAGDPNFDPKSFDPPMRLDQRGRPFRRIVNGRIDIGAFESGPPGNDNDNPNR